MCPKKVGYIAVVAVFSLLFSYLAGAAPPTPGDINTAIEQGLDYLVETQATDGSWGHLGASPGDQGNPNGDVGITALCVWAFASHGVVADHLAAVGTRERALDDGIDFLVANQDLNPTSPSYGAINNCGSGSNLSWCGSNYHTAISTIALYATHDTAYNTNILAARDFLKDIQNTSDPANWFYGGWSYSRPEGEDNPIDPTGGVNLFIADNMMDMGTPPSQEPFWLSPDIWVTDADGNPVAIDHDVPCKVHVVVRNIGDAEAMDVEVSLYADAPTVGAVLPASLLNIGNSNPVDIPAGDKHEFVFDWTPDSNPPHYSLGAIAQSNNDPPNSPNIEQDNNIAMVNTLGVEMPPDETFDFPFNIENPAQGYTPAVALSVDIGVSLSSKDGTATLDDLNEWTVELWTTGATAHKINDFTEQMQPQEEPAGPAHRDFALKEISLVGVAKEYALKITPPSDITELQKVMCNIMQFVNGVGPVGGYEMMLDADPEADTIAYVPAWPHGGEPKNGNADLSNTQFSIMALALTQHLDTAKPNLFLDDWDDMAQVFIDRCQEPTDPDNDGRAHHYQPEDKEDQGDPGASWGWTSGSMAHAGIWSNALMPPLMSIPSGCPDPAQYVLDAWGNRFATHKWVNSASPASSTNPSDFHYTVQQNYNNGNNAYYYGALSMAKALQMSAFPVITPDGMLHNWYLEFAEELVSSPGPHTQQLIPGSPVIGYWQNSDHGVEEWNTDLTTAYALLVLELKRPFEKGCWLRITLVDGDSDQTVEIGLRDFRGRKAIKGFAGETVNDIPGLEFLDDSGNIVLKYYGTEEYPIEPEIYHLLLGNTDTTNDADYKVIIEVVCCDDDDGNDPCDDEVVVFRKVLKSEGGTGDDAVYPRIPADGELVSTVNLSNAAGEMTPIIAAPVEPSATELTAELDPTTGLQIEQNSQGVIDLNLTVSGTSDPVEVALELGPNSDGYQAGLTEKLVQFSDNPITIDPGVNPDATVEILAYAPLSIDPGNYTVEILVKYRDASGGLTEVLALDLPIEVTELTTLVPFTGTVEDRNGTGLADIAVRLFDRGWDSREERCQRVKIAETQTNLDGTYAFSPLVNGAGEGVVAENAYYDVGVSDEQNGKYDPQFREDVFTGTEGGVADFVLTDRDLGDVSANGEITAYDAALALQLAVGLIDPASHPDEAWAADVDQDGSVTAMDASLILQRVVGLIWEFPEPSQDSPSINISNCLISLPDLVAEAGNTIDLPIELKAEDVYAGQFTLSYDANLLKPLKVSISESAKDYRAEYHADGRLLKISIAGAESISLNDTILNVSFKVLPKAAEGATIPIDVERASLNNAWGVAKKDGSITVNPTATVVYQNFPNPFNPDTWIPYKLAKDSHVVVNIFDVRGELIKTLDLGKKQVGSYMSQEKAVYWDGKNNFGESVASGVYFYSLQAKDFSSVKKMLILK